MNSKYVRLVIPDEFKDTSKWPCPEESLVEPADRYFRTKQAIQMRVDGSTCDEVFRKTGVPKCELIRQLRRCITENLPGHIVGFYALVPYARIRPYVRNATVRCDLLSGSAGAAGALGKLFREHPAARKFVHRVFLPELYDDPAEASCVTYVTLHRQFVNFLIEVEHLNPSEWPLSTKNEGYKSLRKYCDALIETCPERWLRVRKGKQAAWRARIGQGIAPLFDFHEPLVAVQLDYLMCDAAGVLHFEDAQGLDHAIPVRRWYVGLLAETTTSAVFGCYLSFETNPSTDCALATVNSVFDSESGPSTGFLEKLMPDGKWLMVSLVPELRGLAWAVIGVDNGLCNSANDFVNNLIDALGCTVMFGSKRAWWQHAVIESVNGKLTAMGWKCVVSSYGSGPTDPLRGNATAVALAYDIHVTFLQDLFRVSTKDHNATVRGESNFGNTRVEVFRRLLETDYLPQTLPLVKQEPANLRLLWHCLDRRITANRQRGERPHVNVNYCCYTNQQIASDFGLVGQRLRIWIHRSDIRIAHGVLLDDKRSVGALEIERRWSHYKMAWQTFTLIMRQLHSHPVLRQTDDPAAAINAHVKSNLLRKSAKPRAKLSNEAALVKVLEDAGVGPPTIQPRARQPVKRTRGTAFGLLNQRSNHEAALSRRSRIAWLMSFCNKRS
ncbi:hypothetical protein QFZ99_001438 [Paraburkholderia atlantica]|uniref:hypothetical protein n=1 Tax=Paraburkholderia atlantica TaxID=2654982 RepID=UPI003D1B83F6